MIVPTLKLVAARPDAQVAGPEPSPFFWRRIPSAAFPRPSMRLTADATGEITAKFGSFANVASEAVMFLSRFGSNGLAQGDATIPFCPVIVAAPAAQQNPTHAAADRSPRSAFRIS